MHKRMSPHGDFDHMGEAISLINHFIVEKVIFNCETYNYLEKELIKELKKEIQDKYDLQDIDVLKVGHHGLSTSSSDDFINEINPKYSIISVGKKNRYGHPNKEVLNNLRNSKIFRTDEDGSIMIIIKDNKLNIETCSP